MSFETADSFERNSVVDKFATFCLDYTLRYGRKIHNDIHNLYQLNIETPLLRRLALLTFLIWAPILFVFQAVLFFGQVAFGIVLFFCFVIVWLISAILSRW